MFSRHPTGDLCAYQHRQLPEPRQREVAEHLSRCGRCRAELEELAFAARLAQRLPRASMPASFAESLAPLAGTEFSAAVRRDRCTSGPVPVTESTPQGRPAWLVTAGGLAAAIVLALTWYFVFRAPLQVRVAPFPPNALEQRAVAEHARHAKRAQTWQLQTADGHQLQSWLLERAGLFAHLPEQRPADDARHLRLVGTTLLSLQGIDAAAIGYEIDEQPVTLVTAKLFQVKDAPAEARFSKDITYRFELAQGFHVLSWSTDGQAYVLVSQLPHYGEQGCFLCHTTPSRRQLISRMEPR